MATDKFHLVVWLFLATTCVHCVVHPDGISKVSHYQDGLGNYEFGYTVASNEGEHFHKAGKDALGRVVGSYGLTEVDGRHRIVDYVADQNGFRAHVRSNEPGIASSRSDALTVEKTGSDGVEHGLDFAASSDSGTKFGDRLKETSSRVAYSRPREDEEHYSPLLRRVGSDPDRETANGRRRQNRRLTNERTRTTSSEYRPENVPDETELKDNVRSEDHLPFRRYQPPIDPYSSGPQQLIPPPLNPIRPYTSRQQIPQPSTPPYGGIETRNPLLDPIGFDRHPSVTQFPPRNDINRVPPVSMSTIHGGIGDMPYLLNPTAPQGPLFRQRNANYPRGSDTSQHDFQGSNYGRPLSNRDEIRLDVARRPNLVLRAVAIPNGIQAVHVDPATGQIYNSPDFKVYNPRDDDNYGDGLSTPVPRDRNRIGFRNSNSGFGFPENRFLPFTPSTETRGFNTPSHRNYSFPSGDNRNYRGVPVEASLSKPSAKDLNTISRVFAHVNGRQHGRYPVDPRYARHPVAPHSPNAIPYIHDSRPDYPASAMYPANSDYPIPSFRGDFGPQISPRELSEIFPLTFGRRSPDLEFPHFDEPPYFSRSYRSVENKNSEEKPTEKPETKDKSSNQ